MDIWTNSLEIAATPSSSCMTLQYLAWTLTLKSWIPWSHTRGKNVEGFFLAASHWPFAGFGCNVCERHFFVARVNLANFVIWTTHRLHSKTGAKFSENTMHFWELMESLLDVELWNHIFQEVFFSPGCRSTNFLHVFATALWGGQFSEKTFHQQEDLPSKRSHSRSSKSSLRNAREQRRASEMVETAKLLVDHYETNMWMMINIINIYNIYTYIHIHMICRQWSEWVHKCPHYCFACSVGVHSLDLYPPCDWSTGHVVNSWCLYDTGTEKNRSDSGKTNIT